MSLESPDDLGEAIRREAVLYSGKDTVDFNQRIGEDLGIDDLDFYEFIENLSQRYDVDLLRLLETRPRIKVKSWSLLSIIRAFRQPGLVEDPTLARLVDLIERHRPASRALLNAGER